MCKEKGFDGVEFDNMDGYQNDTGFELTAALAARDVALFEAAKQIHDGTAVAGTTLLSMKDGVFGLPDNTEERYGKLQ